MSILDRLLIVTALTAALWWAVSRNRRPAALEAFSFAAAFLTVLTLALEDMRWQLVPWQVLALAVAAAAALRRWRPGHSRRWRRVIGRSLLVVGLAAGGVVLLTAFVPALPEPGRLRRISGGDTSRSFSTGFDRRSPSSSRAARSPD